jgi:ketosteroid isomerase-like protein
MRSPLLVFLTASLFLVHTATGQSTRREKDSMLIEAKMKTFVDDFNNLNWEGFHASFDDDITAFLDSDTLTLVKGRKGVEQVFKSLFDDVRQHAPGPPYLHIIPENMLVQVNDHSAVVTFHMTRKNGISRRTFVWTKAKGVWRIVHINGSMAYKN